MRPVSVNHELLHGGVKNKQLTRCECPVIIAGAVH